MNTGRYSLRTINHGFFRLDGGSMFGAVPKNLWSKAAPADEQNCIRLSTRSLVLEGDGRFILIESGNGDKWDDKRRKIFGIENTPPDKLNLNKEAVTDVILTHLHFDHAGGISFLNTQAQLHPAYPQARHWVQQDNYEVAHNPSAREKGSYLAENLKILEQVDLQLISGTNEILPDIIVHQVDGHTRGLQIVEIKTSELPVYFLSDLVPTRHHLPLPYHMGYDMCTEVLLQRKEQFLDKIANEGATVVFGHDPEISAATIKKDSRDRYVLHEVIEL